jgi:hypothetical protein
MGAFKATKVLVLSTLVTVFGLISPTQAEETSPHPYFDLTKEFPNYFSETTREELEVALGSIFDRLEVPVVIEGKLQSARYFDQIQKELESVDPTAEVVPSGGVVRAVISHIYEQLHMARATNPHLTTTQFLKNISQGNAGIPAYEVRGIGSDFDLLLYKFDPAKSKTLRELVEKLTNSSESKFDMRYAKSTYKRAFFTVGDIKEYEAQIKRATAQGGCDLDFLAFSLKSGKLITPQGFDEIIPNFFEGTYRYLAPKSQAVEDGDKQTIRGFRPLIELPFLQIKDETVLREELSLLLKKVQGNRRLSSKALDQFAKMVRNSRFLGGHNRIYRSAPESIEAGLLELVLAIPRDQEKSHPPIPEFVDRFALGRPSSVPRELLIPIDEFIRTHSDNGILYHGTPDIEKGMAILRGGLFVSGGKGSQGMAAFGRGGYLTNDRSYSAGRAGSRGMVLKLPVRNDSRLRVLDWAKAKNHPWVKSFQSTLGDADLFEALARQQGIDFIVNRHVLLQNVEGLVIDKNIRILLESLYISLSSQLESVDLKTANIVELGKQIEEFKNLRSFYTNLTGEAFPDIETTALSAMLVDRLESGLSENPGEEFNFLKKMKAENFNLNRERMKQAIEIAPTYLAKNGYARLFLFKFNPNADEKFFCNAAIQYAYAGALAEHFSGLGDRPPDKLDSGAVSQANASSIFWDTIRSHNPGLSDEQIITQKISPLLRVFQYSGTLDGVLQIIGQRELVARALALHLFAKSVIRKYYSSLPFESILLPSADYSDEIRKEFNEYLARYYIIADQTERTILDTLDEQYSSQGRHTSKLSRPPKIKPWEPVSRYVEKYNGTVLVAMLNGPQRLEVFNELVQWKSHSESVQQELRRIIRSEYPDKTELLEAYIQHGRMPPQILEDELIYAFSKGVLKADVAENFIKRMVSNPRLYNINLNLIDPALRRTLLRNEFSQLPSGAVGEWLKENLSKQRITLNEHKAFTYSAFKTHGLEFAWSQKMDLRAIPEKPLTTHWQRYLQTNSPEASAKILRDMRNRLKPELSEALTEMYLAQYGLYETIMHGFTVQKNPSPEQLTNLLEILKGLSDIPRVFLFYGDSLSIFKMRPSDSEISSKIALEMIRLVTKSRALTEPEFETILPWLLRDSRLPTTFINQFIVRHALQISATKVGRLSWNLLIEQLNWDPSTSLLVLEHFSHQPYDKKVVIARKIAAMKEAWSEPLLQKITELRSGQNRALIDWMMQLRSSNRTIECETLLAR